MFSIVKKIARKVKSILHQQPSQEKARNTLLFHKEQLAILAGVRDFSRFSQATLLLPVFLISVNKS